MITKGAYLNSTQDVLDSVFNFSQNENYSPINDKDYQKHKKYMHFVYIVGRTWKCAKYNIRYFSF